MFRIKTPKAGKSETIVQMDKAGGVYFNVQRLIHELIEAP